MKQEDADRRARSGEVLAGRYRIGRFLGGGGMGDVFEARHASLNRRFAVKFLHQRYCSRPDMVARFRAEARVAGGLEADNVVAVVDDGEAEDGTPYFVMEYLEGESLAELMARLGPLPVPRAAAAIVQACRGVAFAHEAGVIHRDIKPANLFVARRGDGSDLIKVLDFGVAKLKGQLAEGAPVTKTGSVMGTSHYLAPEQARGEKSVTPRTDVYALGVTLYEALSGHRPHPGESHNQIIYHILTKPYVSLSELRPELPTGLVNIVGRAMAFAAEDRYASTTELAEALEPHCALRGSGAGAATTQGDTLSDDDPWRTTAATAGTGVTAEVKTRHRKRSLPLYFLLGIALGTLVLAYAASGWFSPRGAAAEAASATGSSDRVGAGAPPATTSATPLEKVEPAPTTSALKTPEPAASEPARVAPVVQPRIPAPSKAPVTFERDNPYR
jgi:eukaryotic-like serine/threonine-protein kinase